MLFLLWFQKHLDSSTFSERIFKEEIQNLLVTQLLVSACSASWLSKTPHLAENLAKDVEVRGCLLFPPGHSSQSPLQNSHQYLPMHQGLVYAFKVRKASEALPWTDNIYGCHKGHAQDAVLLCHCLVHTLPLILTSGFTVIASVWFRAWLVNVLARKAYVLDTRSL